jgi:hypothetical protein
VGHPLHLDFRLYVVWYHCWGGMLFDLLKGMVSLLEGKKTNMTCYQYEMLN